MTIAVEAHEDGPSGILLKRDRDDRPRRDGDDRGPRRDFGDRGPRRDFGDRPPRGDRPAREDRA
jgi:small subunit ribosomal protein S6